MSKKKAKMIKFDDYDRINISLKKTDEGGCIIEIYDQEIYAKEIYSFAKNKKEIVDKISKFIGK